MTDEIFEVMKCFPNSFINSFGEVILSIKGNVYFTGTDCKTRDDVVSKLLEWCSRPMAKGEPYKSEKRNNEWRDNLICGLNKYLKTSFTQEDLYWIYDQLGNRVNPDLTFKFIVSGYDLSLLRPKIVCQQGDKDPFPIDHEVFCRAKEAIEKDKWIPVKYRPLTEEEKEEYPDSGFMYDCQLPDDDEEVLVTTCSGYVCTDIFCRDSDCGCYFENYCEEGEIVAWRPLPEPYKEADND